jgi:TonB-linked SusC/RagA family outer membrane protein
MSKKIALSIKVFILAVFLTTSLVTLAQNNFNVSGKVTDSNGMPLEGVTIQEKGVSNLTVTNKDGKFTLNVSSGNAVISLSYVGFQQQDFLLNNLHEISLNLKPLAGTMEDVVVIGYGTQKRRNVTAAVSNFDARNLDERPVLRVDQALIGQMAGVTVKQTSGALGKGMSIQIRGTGSITAGNEPLYVLDGFPLATAAPNTAGNFATGNPLDNINPNDIESVQVLKDAAAAAIYGSRAANGVVIITTKKGQSGKARLSFNAYGGFTERTRKLDMLSAEEFVDRATEIINAQWVASGPNRTASQTNEQRRVILGLPVGQVNTSYMTDDRWFQAGHPGLRYIDWQDEAFQKGPLQNYQLAASGGNENVHYYVSGNYTRQEGMVMKTSYTAYSARANVEVNASKILKFGININPTYSENNDPGVEGKDNILHQMVSFTPVQEDTMGLYVNTGNNGQYRWSVSPNSPIAKLENMIGETKRFRTITSVFGELQIIRGLALKTTVNLDNTDNNSKTYVPYIVAGTLATRQAQQTALNSGTYGSYRKQTLVNENTITYTRNIKGVHDISLLGGMAYNQDKLDRVSLSSSGGFNSAVITTLNAAVGVTGNTTEARNVLISYFGRLQYSFSSKYLLSASIRRDGSSRFGENTKWGVFPSASLGWRVSEENFMKDIRLISELKLRGSWGKSGNYNIGDYSTIPLLGVYNYTFGGTGVNGLAPAGITNPDLSWEKSSTVDVGFDLGVLSNKLMLTFDYYNKLNTDLLLNVPIPANTGFTTYLSNAGSVRNKGWEVELSSRNISKRSFQWTTSANLSHNSNKVVSLAGGQNQILIPSAFDISHSILQVGQPMYSIYVVKMLGILSQDDINKGAALYGSETEGDPKYLDANKDGVIDANDRVIVGHPTPDYVWGITNTVKYKGFDLTVLVQGQWGGSIYSLLGRALGRTGQGFTDNALGTYRDRWRSPSDPGEGKISKAYSTFGRIKNTDWLYSSDYIRVRNITLGYDLGKAIHVKQVTGARLYLTLENFFGHDKYLGGFNPEATNTDLSGSSSFPEAGDYGGLPLPRSFIVGINLSF